MTKLIRNMLGRDSQRSKLYKAERRAQQQFPSPGADVSQPILYRAKVAEMMATEWMARNFPRSVRTPVTVTFNPRMGGAHAGSNGITTGTGPWTMNMLILCHELAHTITRREYGTRMFADTDRGTLHADNYGLRNYNTHRIAGHGPEYADVYLRLVREFIGYEHWKLLRAEFDISRIRYAAPADYGRSIVARPVTALAFATPRRSSGVRNTNPNLSAKVLVNGTPYQSMWVAYQQLLPGASASHMQRHRIELKKRGMVTIVWNEVAYEFVGLPK